MEQPSSSVLKEVILFGLILLVPGLSLSPWLYSQAEERQLADLHDAQHEASLVNPLLGPAEPESLESGSAAYMADSADDTADSSDTLNGGTGTGSVGGNSSSQEKESCWGSYAKYFILLQISLLTFLAFFGEGSVNDWSVIYFTDELDTSPFVR